MTDFVLGQDNTNGGFGESEIDRVWKYANFLKQPIELYMFVPCKLVDGVWVVMKTPDEKEQWFRDTYDNGWWGDFIKYKQEYQQAKEKCLFEGFEFKGETEFTWIFKHNGTFPIMIAKRNIEYLNVYFKREIELTATAQKQLSL